MAQEIITPELIQTKYRTGIRAFSRLLSDPNLKLDFSQECDPFFRRCALCVWKVGGAITPRHVEAYNAISSGDRPGAAILYFELCSSAERARFAPPPFFSGLMALDASQKRDCTGKFIELCSVLMLLFAAVDGAVTPEESAFTDSCCSLLAREAGKAQAPDSKKYITPAASQAGQSPSFGTRTAHTDGAQNEVHPRPDPEQLLEELDSLCGLQRVKKDVRSLINLVNVREMREKEGLPVPPMSLHLVFLGNPGTGKTTVARLLAKLYHAIGVLSKGQLVEVDRGGLVAGYVGQTAIKTQEVINSALGGVLFIDEAYSLTAKENSNDFGAEAVEILLKNMEDHRDDLIVIVAGYQNQMESFIHSNPGLESRFNKYFYFDDYNAKELLTILRSMCSRNGYTLSEEAQEKCRTLLESCYENRDGNFGNARYVRNLFEDLISCQANRLSTAHTPTREELMLITGDDYDAAEALDRQ